MRAELLKRLKNHPSWDAALNVIRQKQHAALYGMTTSQRLLSALALSFERPVVYLLPNERSARQAAEDLALCGAEVAYLPANELRFLRAVTSREVDWQRLRTLDLFLSGKTRMLIASAEALQYYMTPPAWFEGMVFTVKPGDSFQTTELAIKLTDMGYERVDMVEGKGQFALRGDILDIYPPASDMPVRVEFFDVQVDSLRAFDPLSQRSVTSLQEIRISPAAELIVPALLRQAVVDRLKEGLVKAPGEGKRERQTLSQVSITENSALPDLDLLLETGRFYDAHMWAHTLSGEDISLLDWIKDALVIIDTPDRAMQRIEENEQGYWELLAGAIESGMGHPAQAGLLRSRSEVLGLLSARGVLSVQDLLRGMGGLNPLSTFSLAGRQVESYRGRLQDLASDLKQWQIQGFTSVIFTGGQTRRERLASALAAQGVSAEADLSPGFGDTPGLYILSDNLAEGFAFEEAKLVLISPNELFGNLKAKPRRAKTAGQRIEAFTDLSIGDYVVHEHHGIGIYQGTVRLQSEGIWRDYLFIQYHGSDKLYVPTDQFDRVQKYIGSPDASPPLNDLGSGAWSRQKSKVKAGLKELAFDLVKLYAARQSNPGYAFEPLEPFEGQFADGFEYELTADQEQAVREVLDDMEKDKNMDRLLCGDVGYGKTEVAVRAAFRAVMNGKQVAFLAPTTILVQQHMRTLTRRFEGFPVRIGYVSRFQTPAENRLTLQLAREGQLDILLGTHRLLSKDVGFKNLGLLIIDEEQRFGVRHKELIKNYKKTIDVLTLSATPIPRTLHMSMVGVRDMSLLETPPEERFPVATYVVEYKDSLIRDAIIREISRNGQVFFLYNHVREIDRMASNLRQLVPEARFAVAHGQMPEQALEDVMLDFYNGSYDVLLCSTIIENGLDIQNANTLIVYDADHFGLSQLYQLRGRVGRGNKAAFAFFTIRQDKVISETAEKRLTAIKEFTAFGAGFRIAMRDLEIRGAGNIFGPEQSGQVMAVGYDMYVKMIEEAIREAQGDYSSLRESELETRVEISISAYLPEKYVRGEPQRIEVYKRIAMVRNEADEEELVSDMIDRFGEPEEPVINLIKIARLRALANTLGADLVRHDRNVMILRFHPKYAADPSRLYEALVQAGGRMSLTAGKHISMLIKQPNMDEREALLDAIHSLESLILAMDRDGMSRKIIERDASTLL